MMTIYNRYMHTYAIMDSIYDITMSQWLSYASRCRSDVSWWPYITDICTHMLLWTVYMIYLCQSDSHMHPDIVLMCHDVHIKRLYAYTGYYQWYIWYNHVTVTLICTQMSSWCVMMTKYSSYMHTQATITRTYRIAMSQWLTNTSRCRPDVSWWPYIADIYIYINYIHT
jgi:hypothetical protein